jgi:hypothetical protein
MRTTSVFFLSKSARVWCLASLNNIEFAIFRPRIDEQAETAHDTIMRHKATKTVHSSAPERDEAYFAPSDHNDWPNPKRKRKPMSRGEIEGGKGRKRLEGKKHKTKSAGRKNTSKLEHLEEPTDVDNVVKLAESEEKKMIWKTQDTKWKKSLLTASKTKPKPSSW